MYLKAED